MVPASRLEAGLVHRDTVYMPELPEVEYTARQLRATVVGATIREAMVFWERSIGHPNLADFLAKVAGRRIEDVRRRGKLLVLDLSSQLFLTIHRRMTGNLLLLPPGWEVDSSLQQMDTTAWSTKGPSFQHQQIPMNTGQLQMGQQAQDERVASTSVSGRKSALLYCRVCFNFEGGRRLLYTDPRKFGRIELWSSECEQEAFAGLGLEPLSAEFTEERLQAALVGRKGAIKQVLLAQEVVAGLGNIYADEALFYAALHPLRRVDSLSADEMHLLHEGIVSVLTLGIEHGGTSFNDYRDLWGEAGENYSHVQVYQQDGKPCVRCGTIIERRVIAQRSAHFCPNCQKLV